MSFVVMMNGHPACLKSTISKALAKELNVDLIQTNMFGGTITETGYSSLDLRDARYQKAFLKAEELFMERKSFIFDGTFTKKKWREQLYSLCKYYDVGKVIILRCFSSDVKVVEQRFFQRALGSESAEKDSVYLKNYLRDVPLDEPPFTDKEVKKGLASIIVIDSAKIQIVNEFGNGELTNHIKLNLLKVLEGLEVIKC